MGIKSKKKFSRIDFDDPSTTRTGNLAKSAVLAALEEEERERSGQKPGLKRVAWPPPPEATYIQPVAQQQQQQEQYQQQPQQQPISQRQSHPVQTQQVPQPVVQSTPAIVPSYAPVIAQPSPRSQQQQQQRPVSIHSFSSLQSQAPSKPLSPLPLLQTASPQFHSPTSGSPRGWSHVVPPRSPGSVAKQPFYNTAPIAPPFESNSTSSFGQPQYQPNVAAQPNYVPQQQAYTPQQQGYAPHQHVHAPQQQGVAPQQQTYVAQQQAYAPPVAAQQLPYQGNPLRKEAPVTQRPAPVYQSQPVAQSLHGGANRRGDTKWPPSDYRQQAELENEARRRIALGPAFRPKRCNKVDYSQFFAQNALSGTYPGYRIPPGTTHVNGI